MHSVTDGHMDRTDSYTMLQTIGLTVFVKLLARVNTL